jgi:hypothetical protein
MTIKDLRTATIYLSGANPEAADVRVVQTALAAEEHLAERPTVVGHRAPPTVGRDRSDN